MSAFEEISNNIDNYKSFVLEAGAGSGKTYTLIETINYLLLNKGDNLKKSNQKIVCITYTNIAKKEINDRIENNELVLVSTIHEFFWNSIKQFQKQLKIELCKLNEIHRKKELEKGKTEPRFKENLASRINSILKIEYNDSSFNDFEKGKIEHDDVIELSKMIFENYPLLTDIVAAKFPYIFVDEYQDTAEETVHCLINCLLKRNSGKAVVGFFGDSHQKIYDYGIGDLDKYYSSNKGPIKLVKKEENFRSSRSVVGLLNKFRTNIEQVPQKSLEGSAKFIYWAQHPEKPKKDIRKHYAEIAPIKNDYFDKILSKLSSLDWQFGEGSKDKILVLANSRVAKRAGFENLYSIFYKRYGLSTKEKLLDRNHPLITFFVGTIDKKNSQEREIGLEHLIRHYTKGNNNEVIRFIRKTGTLLSKEFKHQHKKEVSEILKQVVEGRKTWKAKEMYEFASNKGLIFDSKLKEFTQRISNDPAILVSEDEKERLVKDKKLFDEFMNIPYSEIQSFWNHVQNHTVFSTKHGTKGDEFRNVLTVIDDTEWVQEYNFKDFFNGTEENPHRKLKTRNLFYVECSRAIENLVVLCLSDLDEKALKNIKIWFGEDNLVDIEEFLKE
ncbi:MAG: ATP-dependent helicase [Bacteroidia bacterium]|nr:ATP-dependent helicase [Bacteroidia bacterium]